MFEDVQYVTDEEGNRSHVIIPLEQYEVRLEEHFRQIANRCWLLWLMLWG